MKYLNILIWINRIVLTITIILYATLILGLYAQIVLGFTQVLSAVILLFFVKQFSLKNQNRITIYWGITLFYGLLYLADLFDKLDSLWVVMLILIPLSIAGYFTYIIESLRKEL